jgi:hypothetical protein
MRVDDVGIPYSWRYPEIRELQDVWREMAISLQLHTYKIHAGKGFNRNSMKKKYLSHIRDKFIA